MTIPARRSRFSTIDVLTPDTPVLGATAKDWDKALTGNMGETLAQLKERTQNAPKRDVPEASSSGAADTVGNTSGHSQ